MATKFKHSAGDVFGEIMLTGKCYVSKGHPMVEYICSCGVIGWTRLSTALLGGVKSCGCLREKALLVKSGERYGSLTLTGNSKRGEVCYDTIAPMMAEAICDCGDIRYYSLNNLKKEHTTSCGCKITCILQERNITHGLSSHPLYSIYQGIRARCYNENSTRYADYGERGIKMCEKWFNDFVLFYNWALEHGWEQGLTIERVDNDGIYSPDNCICATWLVQSRNKRDSLIIELSGKKKCLSEWCEDLGLHYGTVYSRIYTYGWDIGRALLNQPKST